VLVLALLGGADVLLLPTNCPATADSTLTGIAHDGSFSRRRRRICEILIAHSSGSACWCSSCDSGLLLCSWHAVQEAKVAHLNFDHGTVKAKLQPSAVDKKNLHGQHNE
jgi:hypothetical protein